MKVRQLICVMGIICLVVVGSYAVSPAQEKATPQDVIQKVKEAVDVLGKSGGSDLNDFNRPDGPWVFKDTYVVLQNCETGVTAAHPLNPKLLGKNQLGMKDIKGNLFFAQLCDVAKEPGGGWVEYWFPKPNEQEPSRKVSYALQVPNTPFIALAGIYDDKISVEELNKLIKK